MSEVVISKLDYVDGNTYVFKDSKAVKYQQTQSPEWNCIMQAESVTPALTLPAFGNPDASHIFTYYFTAATANASFTAPSDAMLVDGDGAETYSAGNTIAYTDLTAGNLYECSFACYKSGNRNYIILITKNLGLPGN